MPDRALARGWVLGDARMHTLLIVHERLGRWARQIRPRVAGWPVRPVETRSADELAVACGRSACPIVVIDPGDRLRLALADLDRAARAAPDALILMLGGSSPPEFPLVAREMGATLVLPATTPPPRVLDLLARWLPLARARSEAGGWAEDRKPEPEPWEYLLNSPMDS